MTMEVDGLRPARLFARCFGLVGARWAQMIGPAIVLLVLPGVLYAYAYRSLGPADVWQFWAVEASGPLILALQSVFAGWVAFLALDRASHAGGPSEGGRLGTVVSRLWSIIPTSIVIFVGMIVGTLLLIVPGIIFGLATCVCMQALAVEGLGPSRAIARSFELTRGRRGALLGLVLMFFVPVAAINFLGMELITGWKPLLAATRDPIVVAVWQPTEYLLVGILQSALFAEIYIELAGRSKHGSSALIAAEFE